MGADNLWPEHGLRVTPFLAGDGPRIAIENDERNRHHRIQIPPELRIPLIHLLRRIQHGEQKVSDRPLSVCRVSSIAVSGDVSRYVVVHYHERVPGNGVRLRRLPLRQDALDAFIQQLWGSIPAVNQSLRPDSTLDSFFAS